MPMKYINANDVLTEELLSKEKVRDQKMKEIFPGSGLRRKNEYCLILE